MPLLHVYEELVNLDSRSAEEDAFLDFAWELALLDDELFEHLQQIEVQRATKAGFMSPEKTHFYRDQVAKFVEYGGLDVSSRKSPSSESINLMPYSLLLRLKIVHHRQMLNRQFNHSSESLNRIFSNASIYHIG
jgi:hypothetical protein